MSSRSFVQLRVLTGFWIAEATFLGLGPFLVACAARHALVVQLVQVQRRRARGATELTGAGASSAVGVAALAELSQGIVVLGAQALHAQAAFQHRVRRAGGAL